MNCVTTDSCTQCIQSIHEHVYILIILTNYTTILIASVLRITWIFFDNFGKVPTDIICIQCHQYDLIDQQIIDLLHLVIFI